MNVVSTSCSLMSSYLIILSADMGNCVPALTVRALKNVKLKKVTMKDVSAHMLTRAYTHTHTHTHTRTPTNTQRHKTLPHEVNAV